MFFLIATAGVLAVIYAYYAFYLGLLLVKSQIVQLKSLQIFESLLLLVVFVLAGIFYVSVPNVQEELKFLLLWLVGNLILGLLIASLPFIDDLQIKKFYSYLTTFISFVALFSLSLLILSPSLYTQKDTEQQYLELALLGASFVALNRGLSGLKLNTKSWLLIEGLLLCSLLSMGAGSLALYLYHPAEYISKFSSNIILFFMLASLLFIISHFALRLKVNNSN